MSDRQLMFEIVYESEDGDDEPVEIHRYYDDGIAEIVESDQNENTFFVWFIRNGKLHYWQDGFHAWMEDNAEVQQEYQQWINRQITE